MSTDERDAAAETAGSAAAEATGPAASGKQSTSRFGWRRSEQSWSSGSAGEPPQKRARSTEQEGTGAPGPSGGNKKKVVLLIAYNGSKYQGLQQNPGVVTISETLEAAIHAAGGIRDENFGTLQKSSWSVAGRTDKGVHAVGQAISLKMILGGEPMQDRINERLEGSGIRVLGIERAQNSFCAHTSCSSREYEYLLPLYVLRAEADDGPLSADERERLVGVLRRLLGTHSFHNYTDTSRLGPDDKSATRYIIDVGVGDVVELRGVAYAPLRFHAQSFVLHQIRKMSAMVAATFRGDIPDGAIEAALRERRVPAIPLAPACSLTLRSALFSSYERRRDPSTHASLHFPECDAAKAAFLQQHILPHVAEREGDGEFRQFALALTDFGSKWSKWTARAAATDSAAASGEAQ